MKSSTSSQHNQPSLKEILSELQALRQEIRSASKRLLPIPEAAEYLGLAPRTVRNDLCRKVFPIKPVKYRRKLLFRRDDLDRYIDGMAGEVAK
ncbi:MAG: helix-turn-helix domain-containing protein [Proteobacteria bacterium]|nr:helix-turn-helix domain-containing protein [Pseudomonadota bacterium]